VQSLARLWVEQGRPLRQLAGMRCLVSSTLPAAGGLASSSALVVGCALAFAACNDWWEPTADADARRSFAERLALAEHYVGTQGGGMDQAVCLLARAGHALRIEFFPLRVAAVPFPEGCVVVAAHSGVLALKAEGRRLAYNRRVLECAIGKDLLARHLGVAHAERLSDLRRREDAGELRALTRAVEQATGGREALSVAEAASLLGMDEEKFAMRYLRMKDGSPLTPPPDGLKVLPRCRHVFSEAARVERAVACLQKGDVESLGRLMSESHRSCAADYEVSCAELDALVQTMEGAGASCRPWREPGPSGRVSPAQASGDSPSPWRAMRTPTPCATPLPGSSTCREAFNPFKPAAGACVERLTGSHSRR